MLSLALFRLVTASNALEISSRRTAHVTANQHAPIRFQTALASPAPEVVRVLTINPSTEDSTFVRLSHFARTLVSCPPQLESQRFEKGSSEMVEFFYRKQRNRLGPSCR